MDLRGSSCTKASGSRVSNIPPAPLTGPLKRAVPLVRGAKAGEKAAAPAMSEARAMILVYENEKENKKQHGNGKSRRKWRVEKVFSNQQEDRSRSGQQSESSK